MFEGPDETAERALKILAPVLVFLAPIGMITLTYAIWKEYPDIKISQKQIVGSYLFCLGSFYLGYFYSKKLLGWFTKK